MLQMQNSKGLMQNAVHFNGKQWEISVCDKSFRLNWTFTQIYLLGFFSFE